LNDAHGERKEPSRQPSGHRLFLRNVFSNWAGLVLNMATAFFMSPFLVRNLGDTWYGLWVLIRSTTGYMGLLDGGVRLAVVKYVAKMDALGDHRELNRTISTGMALYCAVAVVVMLGTIGLTFSFPYFFKVPPEAIATARVVVLIAGASMAISLLTAVFGGILTGLQRYDISNQIGISTLLLRTVVTVVLIWQGYGIIALALTHLGIQLLTGYLTQRISFRLRPGMRMSAGDVNAQSAKTLYGYGFTTLVNSLADLFLFRTGELLAAMFLGPVAVTYFTIAATLMEYLHRIVITMAMTLHPYASAKEAKGDTQSIQASAIVGTKFCLLIALPVIAALLVMGDTFIAAWMGPRYALHAAPLLFAMAVGRLFWISQAATFQVLLGTGRHKQLTFLNVLTGALSFLGGLALISRYGLIGMTIGAAIPLVLIHGVVTPWYATRTLGISIRRYVGQGVLRPVVATIPFAAVVVCLDRMIQPAGLGAVAGIALLASPVFLLSAWLFAFNADERTKYLHKLVPAHRLPWAKR
jgi:O-antigen/teichoic acid export membrane protein